jgi:hypothetical protein
MAGWQGQGSATSEQAIVGCFDQRRLKRRVLPSIGNTGACDWRERIDAHGGKPQHGPLPSGARTIGNDREKRPKRQRLRVANFAENTQSSVPASVLAKAGTERVERRTGEAAICIIPPPAIVQTSA